jgi:two-component system chemotaxis response regulator CheB
MKILIVDDSVVFRTAIKSALEKIPGVEIVGVAPNGKIALDKVGLMQVDLLTLDLEMPDLDGIQTLKVLREKFGRTPRVVVFSATTTTGAERAIEALNAGADEVLAKPAGYTMLSRRDSS